MSKEETTGRKRRKKHHLGFYIGLFFAAVVVYVVANIVMMGGKIQTTIIQKGSEEDVLKTTGYIFKESTVMSAPVPGYISCEVEEDGRVKMSEAVVSLYKNEINYQANSELRATEEQIEHLNENPKGRDTLGDDPVKIEQNISGLLRNVHIFGYKKDGASVSEICNNVNGLITKKRIISGKEVKDENNEIERLKAKKAEIEKENNVDRSIVYAPKTGVFTAVVDGLEDELSSGVIEDVTPSYLKNIDGMKSENLVKKKVDKADPIGKIVNNYLWYVAVVVNDETAKDILPGDEVSIRFTALGGEAVTGTVTKKSVSENGEVAVVISSNKYVDSIYSVSKTDVEIIRHTYDGFRIPVRSIRIIDQQKGVYVIRNDKAKFLPVNTVYTGKDWVIITEKMEGKETVKLYDELIVRGADLYDGKDVR